MNTRIKKKVLLLIMAITIGTASGQGVIKVGGNPTALSTGTVLEVESTIKGFLLPRMTRAQRDAIVAPSAGLQVWCTDCNTLTTPATGELSINYGSGWVPLALVTTPKVTTGKKSDPNPPVQVSATSVTINGVLVSTAGIAPTETGMIWKEITGNDFGTLPLLDANAVATVPVYKTVGTLVTTAGAAISVTIPSLTSSTSSTRPYYFRTYAKNTSGVGYGNAVIFNCAPPAISTPVVTGGNTAFPAFTGTLTVNAGTPQNTITEYGYCSSTSNPPTTANNKVVLSTVASLAGVNTALNSETFTADPTVDLTVNNYTVVSSGTSYFRYYVIANGITTYSPVAVFSPIVSSPAVVSSYSCATASVGTLTVGAAASAVTQTITATVSTVGTYNISAVANGVTFAGSGNFSGTGAQNIVLTASGTPVAAETSNFVLNTTPNCTFSRVINSATSNGVAVVSSYSCGISYVGTLTSGTAASGVSQTIQAIVSSVGTYSISAVANGVTFAASGTFAGTGAQNVVLTATGTPIAIETSNFVINTTPNCSFPRVVKGPVVKAICDGSTPTTVVPITSNTGRIWMDRNLGASRAAIAINDYQAYGCLYQWGRGNDGHGNVTWTAVNAGSVTNNSGTISSTDSPGNNSFITSNSVPYDWRSPQNNALWQGVNGTNNPCPSGYRLPTQTELNNEITTYKITSGYAAYASIHKFVLAGHRDYYTSSLYNPGVDAGYWSSSIAGTQVVALIISSDGSINPDPTIFRAVGFSVRCIKD